MPGAATAVAATLFVSSLSSAASKKTCSAFPTA